MTVWDELKARGLIAQVTDEEEIKEMVNNGKATFYIGFDPTADSLHVGHFMALCLMKRLQMAGNKPIALLGGGTGMIGDPSAGNFNLASVQHRLRFNRSSCSPGIYICAEIIQHDLRMISGKYRLSNAGNPICIHTSQKHAGFYLCGSNR